MDRSVVTTVMIALASVLPAACGGGAPGTASQAPAPAAAAPQVSTAEALAEIVAGEHRSAANKARDAARHPVETLGFFGVQPTMSVIEIWPAGGWYTEILAPYLRDQGRYIAAHWDPEAKPEFIRNGVRAFREKLEAEPGLYGKAEVVVLAPPAKTEMVAAESVDMVLTFRNIHNWMANDQAETMFAAMYRVLKPGGVLGVVEHRAPADVPQDPKARSGYVREDFAVELAEKAGFVLEAASEVNANPADTRDHEGGVWALPPTLRHGEKDREKYLAIGESDRFTLRFRKPGTAAAL